MRRWLAAAAVVGAPSRPTCTPPPTWWPWLPSSRAWTGGSRWFRCDLSEADNVEDGGAAVGRTSSLRAVLRSPSPLRLGCYMTRLDPDRSIRAMPAVDCGKAHNSEFVGVWTAPNITYPKRKGELAPFYAGCRKVIAKYVGVPADENIHFRTGVVIVPGDEWDGGDRGVRCYLWFDDRKLTKSLKGAGPAALPIG